MAELIREPIEPFGITSKNRKKSLFSKIGVVGAGRDGRNIIRIASSAGLEVVFVEDYQERIDFCFERINDGLEHRVENWGLTPAEKKMILGRIKGSLSYSSLADCDFVIECIRFDNQTGERDTDKRKQAFKEIEKVVSPETIIATNATTVVISELASKMEHKERCVSIHFPIAHSEAKILEIVKGIYTSDEVYEKVLLFAKSIDYDTIEVHESSGLVSLRMMCVLLNEACQVIMENIAQMEAVNRLTVIVYGMRLGIFQMADVIGIEKIVSLMEDMFNEYGDKKYKPSPILWRLYRTHQFGIKTGRGFFTYKKDKIIGPNPFLNS